MEGQLVKGDGAPNVTNRADNVSDDFEGEIYELGQGKIQTCNLITANH